jgi:hypothetical protein
MLFNLPNGDVTAYPPFVAGLAKPGIQISASLTSQKAHAWHMASGLAGEVGELFEALVPLLRDEARHRINVENVIEELGDIEFFMEGLRGDLFITREDTMLAARVVSADAYSLPGFASDVFDAVKRWCIYEKDLDGEKLMEALGNLEVALSSVRRMFDLTPGEIVRGNVMKLGTRYQSLSYSNAAAQDRADKAIH